MRVPQPPGLSSSAVVSPKGTANLGGLLFGYFLLAAQEKVTSRRAAPGNNQAPVKECIEKNTQCEIRFSIVVPLLIRNAPYNGGK